MNVYEGSIVTCDAANTVCRYLAEDGGKIVFLGDALPEHLQNAPIEQLNGRALLPAFADTHLHFSSFALFSSTLDVREGRSHAEIGDIIRAYVQDRPGKFVIGFGVSAHHVREKALISREQLDQVCPDIPVMIVKYDGHAAIVNTALVRELPAAVSSLRGYHADSGEMNLDAFYAVTNHMTGKISTIGLVRSMLHGIDQLAGKGIGLIHTAEGVGFPGDLDVDMARFLARGQRYAYPVRLFFQTMDIDKVHKRKLPRIGGCFATALDGCFGSEDAALLEPYANNEQNKGVLYYSDRQVTDFVIAAHRAGLQVALHAIGDAAIVQALDAFEAALRDCPREDHRHIIIHACLPTGDSLERIARLGICLSVQPVFLDWALEPPDYIRHILGHRADQILPLRDMLDLGIHMSGGSDAPCTWPDPIVGLYQACNHIVPGQSITIPEALRLFTYEAARMGFDEKQRGSLEVGKTADMTLLNQNPLSLQPQQLLSLRAEKLILSGKEFQGGQTLGSLVAHGIRGTNKHRQTR